MRKSSAPDPAWLGLSGGGCHVARQAASESSHTTVQGRPGGKVQEARALLTGGHMAGGWEDKSFSRLGIVHHRIPMLGKVLCRPPTDDDDDDDDIKELLVWLPNIN
ncbi:hypothetical protein LZ31DRAFT_273829 [Colletotrichum somersetense]|nr:hypothetical protein LZ31DRAFT_273829 [Colletotrichum somersetense]